MFSSRIDRTGFFIGIMAYFIVLLPLYIYFISISLDSIFYYVFILPIITGMSLPVRRLHDMGLSGWACLLLFMPLASAFVLFALLVFKSKMRIIHMVARRHRVILSGYCLDVDQTNESVQLSAPVTPIAPAMNPAVVTGNYYHVNRGSREYVAIALLAATGLMVLCFVAMVAISAGLDEHSPSAEEFNAFGMVFSILCFCPT